MFVCVTISVSAQIQVESKIDSMEILIGQQAHVTLNVTAPKGQNIIFPTFRERQEIVPGVPVLNVSDEQTTDLGNNMVRTKRVYTLTSFDDTLYYLPPMTVKVAGKPYKSKELALKVMTVPVDTLHPNNYFPAKDVQDNPFAWEDWSGIFWMSLLLVLLCLACFYIYMRIRDNKPIITHVHIIKKIPPHQKAMKEIEHIKSEQLMKSDNPKEYYTKLTDTLRIYIAERFGINALEMTSSELLDRLKEEDDQKKYDELRELFETADLVKFAKYSTQIYENDMNLSNVIEFINSTKQDNTVKVEKIEPKLTEEQQRSIHSRIVLKSVVVLLVASIVAIVVYVIYNIYMLTI